ncbi:MAG: hypothetical protein ACOYL6_05930 [Bacteriovoracaceae bacterium]
MAKKTLQSGFKLTGIAPNILLKHVENTAPFLFEGKLKTTEKNQAYLAKLIFYKKHLKQLSNLNLAEYFNLCMSAHWATAGTFVPTDVDNQIREGLWKHPDAKKHMEAMGETALASWAWDYEQVTNRKSYHSDTGQVLSTHEGTWLSVAIGAYCALFGGRYDDLAVKIQEAILLEISREETLLLHLREKKDHINFLRTAALMAHNFGDLDRVMDQWEMDPSLEFYERIYKLGHRLNSHYSPILVYTGQVNKEFLAQENHRHMSMRQPRSLRRSHHFLIPVGPFMDDWGHVLGASKELSLEEKGEIVSSLYEGFTRQDRALGYVRAYKGLIESLPEGLKSLEQFLPYDLIQEMKKSGFIEKSKISKKEFEDSYRKSLNEFVCPLTGIQF